MEAQKEDLKKEVRLYGVLSHCIDQVWEHVAPQLEKAISYSDGKFQLEDVYRSLIARDMQLWVVFDKDGNLCTSVVSQILNFPRKKVFQLLFIAGKDSEDWLYLYEDLKDFAKEHGCVAVEGYGRPGWERLSKHLGFKKIHTIYRFDIT
jgi:phage pi2 protein 07